MLCFISWEAPGSKCMNARGFTESRPTRIRTISTPGWLWLQWSGKRTWPYAISFTSGTDLDAGNHPLGHAEDVIGYGLDKRIAPMISGQVKAEAVRRKQKISRGHIVVRNYTADPAWLID